AHGQSPSPHHLRKHTRSQGPLLSWHCPASTLIRPCPTPVRTAKATFVTRLQPSRSPGQAARQLPDQSTTLRMESSSTDDSRLRGALPKGDIAGSVGRYLPRLSDATAGAVSVVRVLLQQVSLASGARFPANFHLHPSSRIPNHCLCRNRCPPNHARHRPLLDGAQ